MPKGVGYPNDKKNRKAVNKAMGKLPVPIPGSASGILEAVRKAFVEATGKPKKSKEKK